METQVEQVGDVRIVHLRGRLDVVAAEELGTLLDDVIKQGATKLILDCGELHYVGSCGLGAFVSGGKKLGPNGKLVFVALNRHVTGLFEMTGLNALFSVCGSTEDALRLMAEP